MRGPQHYAAAEQLIEHAAAMLHIDLDPQRVGELVLTGMALERYRRQQYPGVDRYAFGRS